MTAKQVVTLVEWKHTIVYSFPGNKIDDQICCDTSDEDTPPFLGVHFLSFDFLGCGQGETLDARMEAFAERFQAMCKAIVCSSSSPGVGQLSNTVLIRSYRCANCADVCITVNTWRLQDIFLVGKAIQLLNGRTTTIQSSPLWSMAAHTAEKKRITDSEKITGSNSDITVDFHLDILDSTAEKDFLTNVPANPAKSGSAVSVERVGGILGVGNYSVHLPFAEYWKLVCAQVDRENASQYAEKGSAMLSSLIHLAAKEKLIIRNQRLRFCYQSGVMDHISGFLKKAAECNLVHEREQPKSETWVNSDPLQSVEAEIAKTLKKLAAMRNKFPDYEYPYREALARADKLLYSFNDFFYGKNIHSYVFASQFLALLGGMNRYQSKIESLKNSSADGVTLPLGNKNLIDQYTAAMIRDCNHAAIAIGEYNRALMVFSRNHIHSQNYGMYSKVNIEKYLIAYSAFLIEICKKFNQDRSREEQVYLYPFCYLDKHEQRITMYTLFRWTKQSADVIPDLLPVACPNYRSFANAYRLLPLLTHEISHQFRYLPRKDRNQFIMDQVWEYIASIIARQLVQDILKKDVVLSVEEDIFKTIAGALKQEFNAKYGNTLGQVAFRELTGELVAPSMAELLSTFGIEQLDRSILQPGNISQYMRKFLEHIDVPVLTYEQASKVQEKYDKAPYTEVPQEYGIEVPLLLCTSAAAYFFSEPANLEQNKKWAVLLEKSRFFFAGYDESGKKMWSDLFSKIIRILQTYSLQTPDFKVGVFRDVASMLMMLALRNMLKDKHPWLKMQWQGKQKLIPEEQERLRARGSNRTSLESFWLTYGKLMTNPEKGDLLDAVAMLRRFADRALGLNGAAAEKEDVQREDVRIRDSLLLKPPSAEISSLQYTNYLLSSFLLELQDLLDCFDPFVRSLGKLADASLTNQGESDRVQNLAESLAAIGDHVKNTGNIYSTTTQKLLSVLCDKPSIAALLRSVINRQPLSWWVGKGRDYINLYSEICADLGMCAAYGLDELGYLSLTANQRIKDLKNNSNGNTHLLAQDRRFEIVVDILLIRRKDGREQSCSIREHGILLKQIQNHFSQITGQLIHELGRLFDRYADNITEDKREQFQKTLLHCQSVCAGELLDITNPRFTKEVFFLSLDIIQDLDDILTILREYAVGVAQSDACREDVRRLGTYQTQFHTTRYITNSMSFSSLSRFRVISTPEEKVQLQHFNCVMERIEKQSWVNYVKEDSFCQKIGEHYNNWGEDVLQPCSLSDQLDFIFRYYNQAHQQYMALEKKKEETAGTFSDPAKKWFINFYGVEA